MHIAMLDPTLMAKREATVVTLRSQGMLPGSIVREMNRMGTEVTLKEVRLCLAKNAAEIRAKHQGLASVRFLRQDEMTARLIQKWYSMLLERFDKDVAKSLAQLLERQAKLHGLDTAKNPPDNDSWLDDKSDRDLGELLKQYGLPVPDASIYEPSRN